MKVKDYMIGNHYDLQVFNKQGRYLGSIFSDKDLEEETSTTLKLYGNRKVYDTYKHLGDTIDLLAPLNLVIDCQVKKIKEKNNRKNREENVKCKK